MNLHNFAPFVFYCIHNVVGQIQWIVYFESDFLYWFLMNCFLFFYFFVMFVFVFVMLLMESDAFFFLNDLFYFIFGRGKGRLQPA